MSPYVWSLVSGSSCEMCDKETERERERERARDRDTDKSKPYGKKSSRRLL